MVDLPASVHQPSVAGASSADHDETYTFVLASGADMLGKRAGGSSSTSDRRRRST